MARRNGKPAGAFNPNDAGTELVANPLSVIDDGGLYTMFSQIERGGIAGWPGSDYEYVVQMAISRWT
jgi:hypothetical protein